jgi:hypothetical protein
MTVVVTCRALGYLSVPETSYALGVTLTGSSSVFWTNSDVAYLRAIRR